MKRGGDSLFRLVRDGLWGDPVAKQQERIDGAAEIEAHAMSDMAYHRTLVEHFSQRVAGINPHDDWWGFAAAKQKQADHQAELIAARDKAQDAAARRQAEETRLAELRRR